ncbi:MAG: DUF4269 domain-containing protein [Acidobacteriota bacterium]
MRSLALERTLAAFDPRPASTLGTGLETPFSDLDVACHTASAEAFLLASRKHFEARPVFELGPNELPTWCRFRAPGGVQVELYAAAQDSGDQNAVLHSVAHRLLLAAFGVELRAAVRRRKLLGIATEPAFAEALGLVGDPYAVLLEVGRRKSITPALAQRRTRRKNRRKT